MFSTVDLNRHITEEVFRYLKCAKCHLISLINKPSDLAPYYPREYYAIPNELEMERLARGEQYKVDIVRRFVKGGRLLEIGPAYGTFLKAASHRGFQVDAIERDGECCSYLAQSLRGHIVQSNAPESALQALGQYEVICMWHVLEHLSSPWRCLEEASRHISDDGVVILATPNPAALQFRILGSRWAHVDAPRHLHLMPIGWLDAVMADAGMTRCFSTSSDVGGRNWNRFGWQHSAYNMLPRRLKSIALSRIGYEFSRLLSTLDTPKMKGSAYTAVYTKHETKVLHLDSD